MATGQGNGIFYLTGYGNQARELPTRLVKDIKTRRTSENVGAGQQDQDCGNDVTVGVHQTARLRSASRPDTYVADMAVGAHQTKVEVSIEAADINGDDVTVGAHQTKVEAIIETGH